MTKKERAKLRRQRKIRRIVLTTALVALVAALAIGGTIAWLTSQTTQVVNTFKTSNIDITLEETENLDLTMVPGSTITKDPKATVIGGSEACHLFVKVEKSTNFDTFMSYEIADGWKELTIGSGIYYCTVSASDTDQSFDVIKNNKVTVKDSVTKGMMDAIVNGEATAPTLTFTAYACQSDNRTVDEAAVALGLKTETPATT